MIQLNTALPYWSAPLFSPKRYKVIYGGRGAARSWSFARAIIIKGSQEKLRVLCAREYQKSIADSVHKLLVDQINLMQMPGWKITKTEISHAGTGTTIIFEGLRYNVNRIKSLEGIDICWVEEAESVAKDSWETLIPTIRKPGSEIWISFNPNLEEDPTYQRFVVNQPPNAFVLKVGWMDNPWFPETLMEEKDYLYRVDPDAAEHVWGGYPKQASDAQILAGKWKVESFEVKEEWEGPFYGSDFGFAEDPATCIEVYIDKTAHKSVRGQKRGKSQGRLMIRRESWKLKLDNHKIIPEWKRVMGNRIVHSRVWADQARPETISYLRQHGMPFIQAAIKWPGSIEDGIAYLRGFEEIVIHPDCVHAKEEARLWSYKVDKQTQEILPEVVDKHNHIWDAIRYALIKKIRAHKGASKSSYRGITYVNGS